MFKKDTEKALTEADITFSLLRSRRRTIAVQVRPGGEVIVRAPLHLSERKIRRFVSEHSDWIRRNTEKLARAAAEAEPLSETELKSLAKQAALYFSEKATVYAERVGVTYGRITIRHQKTRWGSCSAKGNLNFNCLLMLAPEEVREYVIVHELCHRLEMNHSPRFWAEVERVCPDYRKYRKWLKVNGPRIQARQL